jgi:hypothetical protein
VEGMLTEKYLTKYGSRLSHLSVDGPSYDGLPAKYIELILRNCCNVESFSVRLPSDYDVIPSLVDNMTNLQRLTLMGEHTNSFSPRLTELQHLTKLVTPATPECIGEWASQTSLLKVDADLDALKLRLPPKLHLSNLKQGKWSIFMPVKDTNILKRSFRPCALSLFLRLTINTGTRTIRSGIEIRDSHDSRWFKLVWAPVYRRPQWEP